jgi:hypothetical protein
MVDWFVAGTFNAMLMRPNLCTIGAALQIRVALLPLTQSGRTQSGSAWMQQAVAPILDLLRLIETAATRARSDGKGTGEWIKEVSPRLNDAQVRKALATMAPGSTAGDAGSLRSSLKALAERRSSNAESEPVFLQRPASMPGIVAAEWGDGTQEQFDRVAASVLRVEFENNVVALLKNK